MKKKTLLSSFVILLLISLGIGCWYRYNMRQASAEVLTGTVEATKADITAKTSGYIKEIYIQAGDTVQKGDPAAALDRKDLAAALLRDQAALASAQSRLTELENGTRHEEIDEAAAHTASVRSAYAKAQRDADRQSSLLAAGAVAQSVYDDALTARDTAAANLEAAQKNESRLRNGSRTEEIAAAREEVTRCQAVVDISAAQLDDLTLYAPLDGLILTKNFEPGEYAAAGAAIATIADLTDCWVKVYVSAADLAKLQVGGNASIMVDGIEGKLPAHIKEINHQAEYTPRQSITKDERANLVFAVKVAINDNNGTLKPGMPADVIFEGM